LLAFLNPPAHFANGVWLFAVLDSFINFATDIIKKDKEGTQYP
jgi:hypothetical protein